jgi:hypothetical protein
MFFYFFASFFSCVQKLSIFYGNLFTSHERERVEQFRFVCWMKNLPNLMFTSCRISVVASSSVGASRQRVGRSDCSRSAVVAGKHCSRLVRCSCMTAGLVVLADTGSALAVGIDSVAVGFERVELAAEEYVDLRLRPQRRFSSGVQLV